MKKVVSLTLALILALTLFSVSAAAEGMPDITIRYGVLSMLNISEEEIISYMIAGWNSAVQMAKADTTKSNVSDAPLAARTVMPKNVCIYYDTLDAMLMALNAGEISSMIVGNTVADDLCSTNDQLVKSFTSGNADEENFYSALITDTFSTQNFSFMLMQGSEALRDEFSAAIADIRADGTLDQLVADHIDAAIAGKDIAPVEMPIIDGAETVRVAITGSLPPMDYIVPDGTPAGFNTALLAEISKRIGKNIKLVQVDSQGRAAALSSGAVDAVFWTRTNDASNVLAELTDEEYKTRMSEEEAAALERIMGLIDLAGIGKYDLPDGTIITDSYYADTIVPVVSKNLVNAIRGQ